MIARVQPVPFVAWPPGWEDVEVVDGLLVEDPLPAAAPRAAGPPGDARVYDSSGRVAPFQRFGRIVDVVA